MRKLLILSLLGLMVLACSMVDVTRYLPVTVGTPLPDTSTPFPTWTNTLPAPPTHTPTPTLIGQRPSPTITDTPTATPVVTGTPTTVNTVPGPALTPSSMPEDSGFVFIVLSGDQLYEGTCGPAQVDFEVQVHRPERVDSVVMFMKLRNQITGAETGWDRGTSLNSERDGRFTYTLKAADLPTAENPTWVVFQMVGTNDVQDNVARSPVYADRLTLFKCP